MYIQLTSRCNFSCKHCGFSCKAKGEDMSLETFRNALKMGDECITIGGGEPTLHPLFWQLLMEAVAISESVWLATNGSQTDIAITLAGLAKKGVLGVDLSLDKFHDPIDERVVNAFKKDKKGYDIGSGDRRGVRNTSSHLIKAGRSKVGRDECICEDIFIKPSGEVRICGCQKSPIIGTVNANFAYPDDYIGGTCYKNMKEVEIA